jgi:hypothetical protein
MGLGINRGKLIYHPFSEAGEKSQLALDSKGLLMFTHKPRVPCTSATSINYFSIEFSDIQTSFR